MERTVAAVATEVGTGSADTPTPLRCSPTLPGLSGGDTHTHSLVTPTPPALRAPPPPPPGGRGSACDIRWEVVSGDGADAGFPEGQGRASLDPVPLRGLALQWTVADILIGGGADGEGESSPLSPTPKFLTSRRPRPARGMSRVRECPPGTAFRGVRTPGSTLFR